MHTSPLNKKKGGGEEPTQMQEKGQGGEELIESQSRAITRYHNLKDLLNFQRPSTL